MINEKEWYGSEEHFKTEESYEEYRARNKSKLSNNIKKVINAAEQSAKAGREGILK